MSNCRLACMSQMTAQKPRVQLCNYLQAHVSENKLLNLLLQGIQWCQSVKGP